MYGQNLISRGDDVVAMISHLLAQGDHNTKFFHRKAAGRAKKTRSNYSRKRMV
jgi:hypothetical protein